MKTNKPTLDRIVACKKAELAATKAHCPFPELEKRLNQSPPLRDFAESIRSADGVALVAELKKASPSAGVIRAPYNVAEGAKAYARAGAAALSVLTESVFFQGNISHIGLAKDAAGLPVLRKDFLFDPYQIIEARAHGADAVLLIAAILKDRELLSLIRLAKSLGLAPLVEVHDGNELERALSAEAPIVGVNSRNLKDLTVDLNTFSKLLPKIPDTVLTVAESGIRGPKDVQMLKSLGADAMLVGESLLRRKNMGTAARVLINAGK